jgi:hypothetical protein
VDQQQFSAAGVTPRECATPGRASGRCGGKLLPTS